MKLKVGGISPRRSGTRHAAGNNEDNANRKGVLFLPLINCSPPLLLLFFSDSADCFDFSRVLRRNVSSIDNEIFFFFSLEKKGKETEEREKSAADCKKKKGRKRKI